jgi:hypothetical protein
LDLPKNACKPPDLISIFHKAPAMAGAFFMGGFIFKGKPGPDENHFLRANFHINYAHEFVAIWKTVSRETSHVRSAHH